MPYRGSCARGTASSRDNLRAHGRSWGAGGAGQGCFVSLQQTRKCLPWQPEWLKRTAAVMAATCQWSGARLADRDRTGRMCANLGAPEVPATASGGLDSVVPVVHTRWSPLASILLAS